MFPSSSSSSSHCQSQSNLNAHHQARQSKLLDNQAYPQPQPSSRTRHQPTAMKKNPSSSVIPPKNNPTPTCANCGTQTTPLWRRNQSGETLCNACALFQKMKGRPRPISLKTNVIKPRNRIKAIDRIPLEPSYNQPVTARSNSNLINLNHQRNHLMLNNNKNNQNQNYHPNPFNLRSISLSIPSNPINTHLCSSPNSFRSPTSNTHFLDPNHLTPSPNTPILPSGGSHSPSSSQHSFCSTRSAPQAQSHPTQLIRSGVSSRKSSPGGASNYQDIPNPTSSVHDTKRRKYLSDHVLNRSDLCERRTSTGSIELLHQPHHLPLRASSLARIAPTPPFDSVQALAANHRPDKFCHNASPSSSSFHHHPSADDNTLDPSPPSGSTMSSRRQMPVSMECTPVTKQSEKVCVANPSLKGANPRGRSNLRLSRITLPPLSQITKDLVPACQLNPSPINFGPPLSFEASAREARLNSPSSSQNLLTIPSSTHQKRIQKRRAVSVISSVSDSESVISPAHTASSSSRIHSPHDVSHFRFNNGSPITPPVHNDGFIPKSHNSSMTYFHEEYPSGRNESSHALNNRHGMDLDENLDLDRAEHPTEENRAETELNRLKNRIVQLELINGVMENRINELENHNSNQRSQGNLSDASDHLPSSGSRHEERRCSFEKMDADYNDDDCSVSDQQRWLEENELEEEDVQLDEDQEDEIEDTDHDENTCVKDDLEAHLT